MENLQKLEPGRVAQSVGHLTRKSGILGSIPGLAAYFRFTFLFFKKGSRQLLAKVLGLEIYTRPLVFTSSLSVRTSENCYWLALSDE